MDELRLGHGDGIELLENENAGTAAIVQYARSASVKTSNIKCLNPSPHCSDFEYPSSILFARTHPTQHLVGTGLGACSDIQAQPTHAIYWAFRTLAVRQTASRLVGDRAGIVSARALAWRCLAGACGRRGYLTLYARDGRASIEDFAIFGFSIR